MIIEASTHDAHGTVESRPDVVIHALDKVVVGLTGLAVANQYLVGTKLGSRNARTI
jgi:hypothetical protein